MGTKQGDGWREGKDVKRAPLNMRTSPELRDRIEAAARSNGLSLTQEVERRLIESFRADDEAGGPETRRLLRMIGTAIDAAEGRVGRKWFEDESAYVAAGGAIQAVLAANFPANLDPERLRTMAKPDFEVELEQGREAHRKYKEARAKAKAYWKAHPDLERARQSVIRGEDPPFQVRADIHIEFHRLSEEAAALGDVYNEVATRVQELMKPILEERERLRKVGAEAVAGAAGMLRILPGEEPKWP